MRTVFHSATPPAPGRFIRPGAVLLLGSLLGGCAAPPAAPVIDRLTPEQLAAIPPAPADKAAEATRLTQQADREARQAAEAAAQRQRALQSWRAYPYPPYPRWSAGVGIGHPYHRYGWGSWHGW